MTLCAHQLGELSDEATDLADMLAFAAAVSSYEVFGMLLREVSSTAALSDAWLGSDRSSGRACCLMRTVEVLYLEGYKETAGRYLLFG